MTVAVGVWSIIDPATVGSTVWRHFGEDYGYFPLIQPIIGLVWLLWPLTIRLWRAPGVDAVAVGKENFCGQAHGGCPLQHMMNQRTIAPTMPRVIARIDRPHRTSHCRGRYRSAHAAASGLSGGAPVRRRCSGLRYTGERPHSASSSTASSLSLW